MIIFIVIIVIIVIICYKIYNKINYNDIKNKTVLITGGANGLGRYIGLNIVKNNGNIILWDIDIAQLEVTIKYLKEINNNVIIKGYVIDVCNKEQIQKVAAECISKYDIDVLINNVGIGKIGYLCDLSYDNIDEIINTNLKSMFYITKVILPNMLDRKQGQIINISSVMGYVGGSQLSAYCATKFGVIGFTESLRYELINTSITCTCIAPYIINTRMFNCIKTIPFMHKMLGLNKLNVNDVSLRIIEAIKYRELHVTIPNHIKYIHLLRILPQSFMDWVCEIFGVTDITKYM